MHSVVKAVGHWCSTARQWAEDKGFSAQGTVVALGGVTVGVLVGLAVGPGPGLAAGIGAAAALNSLFRPKA